MKMFGVIDASASPKRVPGTVMTSGIDERGRNHQCKQYSMCKKHDRHVGLIRIDECDDIPSVFRKQNTPTSFHQIEQDQRRRYSDLDEQGTNPKSSAMSRALVSSQQPTQHGNAMTGLDSLAPR
jgi:hypothetical protein